MLSKFISKSDKLWLARLVLWITGGIADYNWLGFFSTYCAFYPELSENDSQPEKVKVSANL